MYRAVLDPGVLVAALISPAGAPAALVTGWLEGRFELVVSPRLLDELERVLRRPKFRRYVDPRAVGSYLALFPRFGLMEDDPPHEAGLTADPGDDYLVALARAADAHALVSGDRHLLDLEDPRPRVLTPRAFLGVLGSRG